MCVFYVFSPPAVTARGVFISANQKQNIMKKLTKYIRLNKSEFIESVVGLLCIYAILIFSLFILKVLYHV